MNSSVTDKTVTPRPGSEATTSSQVEPSDTDWLRSFRRLLHNERERDLVAAADKEQTIKAIDELLGTFGQPVSNPELDAETHQVLTEYPLMYKKDTIGTVKIDLEHRRAVFLPEKPVREESAPIKGFLVPRILEPMRTKHGLDYRLDTANGLVQSVTVAPLPQAEQLEELMTATAWAFAKASEANSQ